jgi:undecaprenyl-diphosphatase
LRGWLRTLAWQWIGLVAALAAALVLFAKIGEDVFDHESGTFDGAIQHWTLAHQAQAATKIFAAITIGGAPIPVSIFAGVLAVWLWSSQRRHTGAAVVMAPIVSMAMFFVVKQFFARPRPEGPSQILHKTTYAFPSGHATVSAAVFASLAYVLWRERIVAGRVVLWLTVILVILIGVSRIYLNLHWATDVLGAWCLGLGVAAASAALYERWRPRETAAGAAPPT